MSCIEVPETETLPVFGTRFDSSMKFLRIGVYPCSLADTTQCAPSAAMESLSIGLVEYVSYYRFSDFEDPLKFSFTARDNLHVSLSQTALVTFNLKKVSLTDYRNSLSSDASKVLSYTSVGSELSGFIPRANQATCTQSQLQNENQCSAYVQLEYKFGGTSEHFTRRYTDIFSALSEFGGFSELIVSWATGILLLYNLFSKEKALQLSVLSVKSIRALSAQLLDLSSKDECYQKSGFFGENKSEPIGQANMLSKEREKQLNQMETKVKDSTEVLITQSSDITSIIDEINCWKLVKNALLSPYQAKLANLAAVGQISKVRKEKKCSSKVNPDTGIKDNVSSLTQTPNSQKYHQDLEVTEAIQQLQNSIEEKNNMGKQDLEGHYKISSDDDLPSDLESLMARIDRYLLRQIHGLVEKGHNEPMIPATFLMEGDNKKSERPNDQQILSQSVPSKKLGSPVSNKILSPVKLNKGKSMKQKTIMSQTDQNAFEK